MVYGCSLDSGVDQGRVENFDAIIIGSGQAGNPLAKRLSKEGKRVALIESALLGGTCINYGCTPTKTLVGIAKKVMQARQAADFGIALRDEVPDYHAVHEWKNAVVADFRTGLEDALLQDSNITVFYGKGSFSGRKTVRVESADSKDKLITADAIFINTGARPRIPDIKGLPSIKFLTSKTILELDKLPENLLIIGGGYVALEFAQIYRRMGSKVTIIEKSSRLLQNEDEDVGSEVRSIMEAEGVRIITDAIVEQVAINDDAAVTMKVWAAGKLLERSGTHLLVATGRTPNTEDLHLSNTAVQTDDNGFIRVNDHLQTTQAGIYALGDVKGGPAFTHVSYHDYVVLTGHLFDQAPVSIGNRLIPYCVFIDPELGRIGLTERAAEEMGLDFSVAKMETAFIARAVETGETAGFIKAIVDNNTRKILGVAVICAGGGELMSLLQVAMLGGIGYDQLRDTMFAHPTYAEAINNLFHPIHLRSGTQS